MKLTRPFITSSCIIYICILVMAFGMPGVGQSTPPFGSYKGVPQILPTTEVRLAGQNLTIWLARTSAEKAKGLMFVESLQENQGMLFIYDSPRIMSFWMKNTKVPLDLIFFSDNLEINGLIKAMQPGYGIPEQILAQYVSDLPAQYALELKAGSIDRCKLKLGDRLDIAITLLYSD